MKAIAVLRVSTDSQQIDDQRDELYAFIKSQGYDEIIPIEAVGASAVKLNDKYMYMVQRIKDTINTDKDVKAVFVWHLNRLGRNDVILMEFKEFFIKNHIQFICKNPYLKLLNDDGTVNGGMELAFSLFSTMSKQEVEERKAKFKRAKSSMAKKGQYIGGNTRKYGYTIDENGFFVEDEEEAKVIRTIFDLYSTGKYSTYTLTQEMKERGVNISENLVNRALRCEAYIGESVGELGMKYPAIISKDLFDKCAVIRQGNKIDMKRGERVCLGAKLVKCPTCGATCTSNSRHYICSRHSHHGSCHNGFALRQSVADELLYRFAYGLHLMYLIKVSEGRMDEYKKELDTIEEKLTAARKKIDDYAAKKQRIVDTYLEGIIDKKNRDLRLSKLEDEVSFQRNYINQLEDKRRAIAGLLEADHTDTVETFMRAASAMDLVDKYDIIHKHISTLKAEQISYGERDPRTSRPNAVHIVITSIYGTTSEHLYFPKYYKGYNLYTWTLNDDGSEGWCPDELNQAMFAQPLD